MPTKKDKELTALSGSTPEPDKDKDKGSKDHYSPPNNGSPAIQALIEELNQLNLDDGPPDEIRARTKRARELKKLIHG